MIDLISIFTRRSQPMISISIPLACALLCVETDNIDVDIECLTVFDARDYSLCPRCGSSSVFPLASAVASEDARSLRRSVLEARAEITTIIS